MCSPLLLFLLITYSTSGTAQQAVSCSVPVTSDPRLNIDTTTYEQYVVFTCTLGYTLSTPYYFAQCVNGVWDKAVPTCEVVVCPVPADRDTHLVVEARDYFFGETLTLSCEAGYYVSGPTSLECIKEGWNTTLPGCTGVECPIDRSGNRQWLVYTDRVYRYGDSATFSCQTGYDMDGAAIVTCQADTTWSGSLPGCVVRECLLTAYGNGYRGHINVTSTGRTCQRWDSQTPHSHPYRLQDQENYCRNPSNYARPWCYTTDPSVGWEYCNVPQCTCKLVPNYDTRLQVAQKDYYFNDYVTFSCQRGYVLEGRRNLQCQADGSWNGGFPKCVAVECPIPQSIDQNLRYQNRSYYFNDSLDLTCISGYTLTGTTPLLCRSTRAWSSRFPTCAAVQCVVSGLPPRVVYSFKTYRFMDSIQFSCMAGYEMVGEATLNCGADGSWSLPYPTCIAITCPVPGEETHLVFTVKSYKYPDIISLACQYGYLLSSPLVLWCGADGRWDREFPMCQGVPCPTLVSSDEHLLLPDRQYRYPDEVEQSCETGYRPDGHSSLVCQANGTWSTDLPSCILVKCLAPNFSNTKMMSNLSGETKYLFGSVIDFTCPPKYVISGLTPMTCRANGTWSSSPPTCVSSESRKAQKAPSNLAGGVIAGLLVLIAATAVVILFVRKRRRRIKNKSKVRYFVRVESSIKRHDGGANSLISEFATDDPGSFTDSFDSDVGVESRPTNNYYEFTPLLGVPKGSIAVDNLKNFVDKDLRVEGYVASTFAKFKEGLQEPATVANLPINKSKNRYKQVFPYDTTRVCLDKDSDDSSDYINASYIDGYQKVQQYVAAQVLKQGGKIHCKVKCHQYWPDGGPDIFGLITVTMEEEIDLDTYTIRHIQLKMGNKQRNVTQFHFTAWPDQKVPSSVSAIIQFYRKVETVRQESDVPIVVHCSAGIGRTGTYIALACLSQEAAATGYVNVIRCVETLRRQRLNMVQTTDQFTFIHEALLEHLHGRTSIPVQDLRDTLRHLQAEVGNISNAQSEFEMLQTASPKLKENAFLAGKKEENRNKNRYSNLLPVDQYRPFLSTPVEEGNDYINAVFLSDGSKRTPYITTQMPLPNTVVDFWRLVYEQNITSIVMLNTELDNQVDTVGVYWPEQGRQMVIGPFSVTEMDRSMNNLTDVHTFSLQYKQESPTILRQFRSRLWLKSDVLPSSIEEFLRLMWLVREWQSSLGGTVIVHCMNGLDKSGLFCVVDSALQSVDITRQVDIQSTIKYMRRAQPQIITNKEQYLFCYEATLMYLEQNKIYMNTQDGVP